MNSSSFQMFEQWLSYHLKLAQQRVSAISFALEVKGDLTSIQVEIKKIEANAMLSPADTGGNQDIFENREWEEPYLLALREALAVLQSYDLQDDFSAKARSRLFKLLMPYEAKHDALEYALAHSNNLDLIREQLAEKEEARLVLSRIKDGPMKPGAHPEIYSRCYIFTLKKILELVEQSAWMTISELEDGVAETK